MSNRKYPDTSNIQKSILKSTFVTDGIPCSATLHVPVKIEDKALPAILLVGGWGGV
ncbi:hypothetical protein OHV34_07310 [Acinetobacter baumannii]|nr:hypothetical protein [Acinetobacter baumannii]